jgi:hypothetical protein
MDPSMGGGMPMDPAAGAAGMPPGGQQVVQVTLDDLMQLFMMLSGGAAPGQMPGQMPGQAPAQQPAQPAQPAQGEKPKSSKANTDAKLDQILQLLQQAMGVPAAPAGGAAPAPAPAPAPGGNALAPMGSGMAMPEGVPPPVMPDPSMMGGMPPGAPPQQAPGMTVAAAYVPSPAPVLPASRVERKAASSKAVSLNRIIANLNGGR